VADDARDLIVPGDRFVVTAEGRGMTVDGLADVTCHSLSPDLWSGWAPQRDGGTLGLRVTHVLPPEVVGMGSGRVSGATSVALQAGVTEELGNLRIGDIVAIRDWDATHYTGYHEDRVIVGVVSTGDSPVLGNGPATTILLSGPAAAFDFQLDDSANIASLLSLV
jgi:hypothetical protein